MSAAPVSGLLFFRRTGTGADGRDVYMVVGVLAAPADTFRGEHQHVTLGRSAGGGAVSLTVMTDPTYSFDLTETARAQTADRILCNLPWKT